MVQHPQTAERTHERAFPQRRPFDLLESARASKPLSRRPGTWSTIHFPHPCPTLHADGGGTRTRMYKRGLAATGRSRRPAGHSGLGSSTPRGDAVLLPCQEAQKWRTRPHGGDGRQAASDLTAHGDPSPSWTAPRCTPPDAPVRPEPHCSGEQITRSHPPSAQPHQGESSTRRDLDSAAEVASNLLSFMASIRHLAPGFATPR